MNRSISISIDAGANGVHQHVGANSIRPQYRTRGMFRAVLSAAVAAMLLTGAVSVSAQDIITLKNGEDITVRVVEIGDTEIRYKMYDHLDGPTRTVAKNRVFSINYENGTREVISAIEPDETETANNNASSSASGRSSSAKPARPAASNTAANDGKPVYSSVGFLALNTNSKFPFIGFGGKFRSGIPATPIRLESSIGYFLPKTTSTSMAGYSVETSFSIFDVDIEGQYAYHASDDFVLYPSMGIAMLTTFASTKVTGGKSDASADFNVRFIIGGGVDFFINDKAFINAAPKLWIGDGGVCFLIQAGVGAKF